MLFPVMESFASVQDQSHNRCPRLPGRLPFIVFHITLTEQHIVEKMSIRNFFNILFSSILLNTD